MTKFTDLFPVGMESFFKEFFDLLVKVNARTDYLEEQERELQRQISQIRRRINNLESGYDLEDFEQEASFVLDNFFRSAEKSNLDSWSSDERGYVAMSFTGHPWVTDEVKEEFHRRLGFHPEITKGFMFDDIYEYDNFQRWEDFRRRSLAAVQDENVIDLFFGEFPIEDIFLPKNKPCVYGLYNKQEEIIYIGLSTQVIQRLKSHQHSKRQHGLSHYVVYMMTSEETMVEKEKELIIKYRPSLNIIGNPDRDRSMRKSS